MAPPKTRSMRRAPPQTAGNLPTADALCGVYHGVTEGTGSQADPASLLLGPGVHVAPCLLCEGLCGCAPRAGLLAASLLTTPARVLSPARLLALTSRRTLFLRPISRCKLDLEFDHLVPLRIATVSLGNGHELTQPATRILLLRTCSLGLDGLRILSLWVDGLRLVRLFRAGVFFIHGRIIPRTPRLAKSWRSRNSRSGSSHCVGKPGRQDGGRSASLTAFALKSVRVRLVTLPLLAGTYRGEHHDRTPQDLAIPLGGAALCTDHFVRTPCHRIDGQECPAAIGRDSARSLGAQQH